VARLPSTVRSPRRLRRFLRGDRGGCGEVVAHQEKFVAHGRIRFFWTGICVPGNRGRGRPRTFASLFYVMKGSFAGRQSEDEPTVPHLQTELENVAKEGAVGFCVVV